MLRGNFALRDHAVGPLRLALLASVALLATAPASAQTAGDTVELDEINVEGSGSGSAAGDAADGPLKDFVATRTRGGTKTDTPLRETPASVSVIGRKQIEATGSRTLGEATRYTAGVRELFGGADPRYDQYQIRGFNASTTGLYLDGLQLLASSGLPFKLEPYGLDRIEILRGPSSVLYGGTNPGGLINAVSKKPTEELFAEVTTGINSFGNLYGGFDVGGPIDGKPDTKAPISPQWFYRVTGMGKIGDTQTDHSDDDRVFIAPSVTYKPDEDTSFTVLASYQRDRTTGVPFLPYVGTVTKAPFGRIPTDFITSKGHEGGLYNGVKREQAMLGYQFEHRLDDTFTVRQNARYSRGENELFSLIGGGYVGRNPASGQLNRLGFFANPKVDLFTVDTQVEARFATGALQHTTLFGVDYKHVKFDDTQRTGPASPIDIDDPDYGQPFGGLTTLGIRAISKQDQIGGYVQDQIKLGRLNIVFGGRLDNATTKVDNRLNALLSDKNSDTAFSGRAGLVYDLGFGVSPYVSYSNSFQPLVGINNATQQILKPEKGEQYEAGVKFQPEGWRSFITAAVFDLKRKNFLVANPANAQQTIQSGEARSRGVEIEAVASLAEGLDLVASYTDFNIENTKNLDPFVVGLAPFNTPERYASAFLDYTIQTGDLQGLGAGFGVRYMGKAIIDDPATPAIGTTPAKPRGTLPLPHYTLADAVVHYEKGAWRGAVNVSNLFDKTFVAQCSSATQCFYGERRKVTASLTYRW
ncbi:MAG: TonB-dependent siderophore receptor [Leifsonia xyli]|nr:MAG: TonB-dependent siderophore receptor [Leifsonia xyli]